MSENIDNVMSNLSAEEQEAVKKILSEYSNSGVSQTLDALYDADYNEIPVDIDTFIESDEYAGWFTNNGKDIYPYWREKLREIFDESKNYSEIALSGSIGCGKSTIAVIGLAYGLYKLMCLRDPYSYYKLAKGSAIYIVFFNATLTLSQGVAYTKFQNLLQNSPWFMKHGKVSGNKYPDYVPEGPIRFTVGSQMEHSLGKDILLGLMDEVNFAKGADIQMEKSKIMKLYNSVLERINSRYIVGGKVRGKLFLVSSKKSEYDFIESYIRKQIGKPGIFIADARLYELKPEGTYSGKKFRVAVGGSNLPSKIIPDEEDSNVYIRQGYSVEEVPIEFKGRFELDLDAAMMNIMGISISNVTKFMTYPSIERCTIPQKNPFQSEILTIGTKDNLKYQDFFIPELIPPEVYSKPLFVHFDCSLTGDITGIACTAVLGYTNREGYDEFTGEHVEFRELAYRLVFAVGIQCPSGAEISFRKNREFIYYLKNVLGWNIKAVSSDGFQSADQRQQLETAGFESTIVSLDRKPDGYMCLKSAINERRVQIPEGLSELFDELINLEQNNQTGKVDHNTEHRKDIADGFAGSLYNASLHDGQFMFHLVDDAELFGATNQPEIDEREDFVNGLLSNPANAVKNRMPEKKDENPIIDQFAQDYYNGFIIM